MAPHGLPACYEPYPHSARDKVAKGGRSRIAGFGSVEGGGRVLQSRERLNQ